jgi:adenylate kinase
MNILLFGGPGSGKGTLSQILKQRWSFEHLSMGDFFRTQVSLLTPLGKCIEYYIVNDLLVPDDIVIDIFENALRHKPDRNFVMDGVPRSEVQLNALAHLMQGGSIRLDLIIQIIVEERIRRERLVGRRYCLSCGRTYNIHLDPPRNDNSCDICNSPLIMRENDSPSLVSRRIEIYQTQVEPLFRNLSRLCNMAVVDATEGKTSMEAQVETLIHL